MAISSSSSLTTPFIALQSKPQFTDNLNCSNLCLRIKSKEFNRCKTSGYLKNLSTGGFNGGIGGSNGGLSVSMCSTTPFIEFGGRVGLQRRLGNISLLSFGVDTGNQISGDDSKGGSSQNLSAMLPFVVVATAVAALSQPSSFTWYIILTL